MFNPIYERPIEMFSWQHLVALGIVLVLIVAVFFMRKIFIKYSIADKIFRYFLVVLLLVFELVPIYYKGLEPLFSYNVLAPYPLCTFMLWLTVVALLSNSSRVMKVGYPLAILGASLSLIFVNSRATFPHFNAFAFFFTHGTFLLASLYFVFTKKIARYTIKDFGLSCFFLFVLSCYSLTHTYTLVKLDPNYADEFFLIAPPGGLESIKETLGQVGYTFLFAIFCAVVMLIVYLLTLLCTFKRKVGSDIKPEFKNNKFLASLGKMSSSTRFALIFVVFGLGIYMGVMQQVMMKSIAFKIIDICFYVIVLALICLNEIVNNYLNRPNGEILVTNLKANESTNEEDTPLNGQITMEENVLEKREFAKKNEQKNFAGIPLNLQNYSDVNLMPEQNPQNLEGLSPSENNSNENNNFENVVPDNIITNDEALNLYENENESNSINQNNLNEESQNNLNESVVDSEENIVEANNFSNSQQTFGEENLKNQYNTPLNIGQEILPNNENLMGKNDKEQQTILNEGNSIENASVVNTPQNSIAQPKEETPTTTVEPQIDEKQQTSVMPQQFSQTAQIQPQGQTVQVVTNQNNNISNNETNE